MKCSFKCGYDMFENMSVKRSHEGNLAGSPEEKKSKTNLAKDEKTEENKRGSIKTEVHIVEMLRDLKKKYGLASISEVLLKLIEVEKSLANTEGVPISKSPTKAQETEKYNIPKDDAYLNNREEIPVQEALKSNSSNIRMVMLRQLIQLHQQRQCRNCNSALEIKDVIYNAHGTTFKLKCRNGHEDFWRSSPLLSSGTHAINDILPSTVFLGGGSYESYKDLFGILGAGVVSDGYWVSMMNERLAPTLYQNWNTVVSEQFNELSKLSSLEVVFDGRYDTARQAEWCTVAFFNSTNSKPIWLENLRKGATENISQRMETLGVKKGLQYLKSKGLKITEVIHDDDRKINFLLNNIFPELYNSLCAWHKAKNVKKSWVLLAKKYPSLSGITAEAVKKHFIHSFTKHLPTQSVSQQTIDPKLPENERRDEEKRKKAVEDAQIRCILLTWYNLAFHYFGFHENCEHKEEAHTQHIADMETFLVVIKWCQSQLNVNTVPLYRHWQFTSIAESFAHKLCKFAKKYNFFTTTYPLRTYCAFLDALENTNKKPYEKTNEWKKIILKQLLENENHSRLLINLKQEYETKLENDFSIVKELNEQWFGSQKANRVVVSKPKSTLPEKCGCKPNKNGTRCSERCGCFKAGIGCGTKCGCQGEISKCQQQHTVRKIPTLYESMKNFIAKNMDSYKDKIRTSLAKHIRQDLVDALIGVQHLDIQIMNRKTSFPSMEDEDDVPEFEHET